MTHLGVLDSDITAENVPDVEATVEVYVDGKKVRSKNSNIKKGDLEGNGRFRLELYNTWGSGTADNPVVMSELLVPEKELRVIFTLTGTGFNTEDGAAETAAPAESSSNTGLIIDIISAVVVVKKRKTPADK